MSTGVFSSKTTQEGNEIKPSEYEIFTFHNKFLTGLSGELFFNHPDKVFRVGFSNPLAGKCKGLVDARDSNKPFNNEERAAKDCLGRANDNEA